MKVIATIERVTRQLVPIEIDVESPADALGRAHTAALALREAAPNGASGPCTATVVNIVDAESKRALFESAAGSQMLLPGHFEVHWSVVVDASDAMHAACIARVLQANPESPMACFSVKDASGQIHPVNLQAAGSNIH